jgi:hypothetical protein
MGSHKHAFNIIKPSSITLHHCLEHQSLFIVLPYHASTSVSIVPLEEGNSDVQG